MTLVFMSVFAMIAGDRRLLLPSLAVGVLSILWWRIFDDLRLYGVVQFLPVLAIPFMVLRRPAPYSGTGWIWGMFGGYAVAKVLEAEDGVVGKLLATGGHPWKHIAAAAALLSYCEWIRRRRPVRSIDNTCRASVL
jgi:hypothetical protein